MRVPNLHTAHKRHLIKIRTFLKKIDSHLKMYTACQNYMQIDIFALTQIVFNKNSRNVARYMATLTHVQI